MGPLKITAISYKETGLKIAGVNAQNGTLDEIRTAVKDRS